MLVLCSNYVYFCKLKLQLFRNKHVIYEIKAKNITNARLSTINKPSKFLSNVLIIIPLTAFCLGCWQLYRLQWKLNLINELKTRTKQQPIDLIDNLEHVKDLEYRKVKVRGTFDHSREVYITPRSLIKQKQSTEPSSLLSSKNTDALGSHVITPFNVSQSDKTILVNRGWVPRRLVDPKSRQNGQIDNEIELIGVIRNTEKRQPFGLKDDIINNTWRYRHIEQIAAKLNTEPIFIDADSGSTIPGGPVGGQTLVTLRNEHLSYIITWYC